MTSTSGAPSFSSPWWTYILRDTADPDVPITSIPKPPAGTFDSALNTQHWLTRMPAAGFKWFLPEFVRGLRAKVEQHDREHPKYSRTGNVDDDDVYLCRLVLQTNDGNTAEALSKTAA